MPNTDGMTRRAAIATAALGASAAALGGSEAMAQSGPRNRDLRPLHSYLSLRLKVIDHDAGLEGREVGKASPVERQVANLLMVY